MSDDTVRFGLYFLLSVTGLVLLALLFSIPARLRRARMQRGVTGIAYVRDIVDLHSTGNGRPHVRYDVEITPSGGTAYSASKEVRVFPLDSPAANIGQSFPVTIDPRDPQYFEFQAGDEIGAASASLVEPTSVE